MIGRTVSHYAILDKLGEGGMGVVYKARDLTLDRIVALKFLPQHLTAHDTEKARFLQEAKAASALNHPNVCTIYGIEEHEGQQFIVMELIDGLTLRRAVEAGPLSQNDAIAYAVQIGEALQEAHARGIVHRDIKADNIMVDPRGRIKVMDFGLAKVTGSLRLTKTSSTVGTLAYMAPEQIQGADVDARSDIFSFGVVLFEMLTGRLPFRGEHDAAMMYSIVNDEPEPLTKYLPAAGSELLHVINRALEKGVEDRYQSVNEMVIDLRRLQKQSNRISRTSLASMPVTAPPAAGAPSVTAPLPGTPPAGRPRTLLIGLAALAALLAAVAVWRFLLAPPSQPALNPSMSFRTLDIPFQEVGYPALSRDGGWVAFAGNADGRAWDIHLMNANSGEPRRITGDSAGFMQNTDFSPDGSQIVYDRSDKGYTKPEIALVSTLGGSSRRIVTVGYLPRWRPDGKRIGYVLNGAWGSTSGATEFRSVDPGGSDDRLEFADTLRATGLWAWSPDGGSICLTRNTAGRGQEIFVRELATGAERRITSSAEPLGQVFWTRQDDIIFSREQNGSVNLWILPAAGGNPVQITRGSGPDLAAVASGDVTRLLYLQQQSVGHIWHGSLERDDSRQLTLDEADIGPPAFSPDGARLVYPLSSRQPSGNVSSLFVLDRGTQARRKLHSEEGNVHNPRWSPDGTLIAYAAHRDSVPHDSAATYVIDAENGGSPRKIGMGFPKRWLDAARVLAGNSSGSWIYSIDGAAPVKFFRDSTDGEPVLGGKAVLFVDPNPGRRAGVWLASDAGSGVQSAAPRQLIKSLCPYFYDATTQSVYYVTQQGALRRISLPGGNDQALSGRYPGLRVQSDFQISPDGKTIAWLDSRRVSKMVVIDNFR